MRFVIERTACDLCGKAVDADGLHTETVFGAEVEVCEDCRAGWLSKVAAARDAASARAADAVLGHSPSVPTEDADAPADLGSGTVTDAPADAPAETPADPSAVTPDEAEAAVRRWFARDGRKKRYASSLTRAVAVARVLAVSGPLFAYELCAKASAVLPPELKVSTTSLNTLSQRLRDGDAGPCPVAAVLVPPYACPAGRRAGLGRYRWYLDADFVRGVE